MENNDSNQNNDQKQKTVEKKRSIHECKNRDFNFGNLFLGLVILIIGIFYLSQNYGWLPENMNLNILRLWPILVIAFGLSLLNTKDFLSKLVSFIIFLIVIVITSFIIFII